VRRRRFLLAVLVAWGAFAGEISIDGALVGRLSSAELAESLTLWVWSWSTEPLTSLQVIARLDV
jgi:ABC-type glycerol-3-phosphate transport system substrate-binding protein